MGKTRYIKHRKYQNLWMNNEVESDKMQFVCIFLHVCRISAENYSYAFQQCKNYENRLTFDRVTESLKVGTFFWDTV